MRAIVIGGGVSGLSCGVRLLETGVAAVEIWADQVSPHTTSDVAAALWGPYRIEPAANVARWAVAAYREFERIAADPESGVMFRSGLEIVTRPVQPPAWASAVRNFRPARPEELPQDGHAAGGFAYDAPAIEMPLYMPWLRRRFETLGGRIVANRKLQSLEEALAECQLVIDCAGLGARELADDRRVYPIRGQVVRVPQVGIERFTLYEDAPGGLTYIFPRSRDIVLGGTAEEGVESLEPDPRAAQAILERCLKLEPRLRPAAADAMLVRESFPALDISKITIRVGLRPARTAVRLEAESRPGGKLVIHNYGHGGAGVTVSWGCAAQVAEIASSQQC